MSTKSERQAANLEAQRERDRQKFWDEAFHDAILLQGIIPDSESVPLAIEFADLALAERDERFDLDEDDEGPLAGLLRIGSAAAAPPVDPPSGDPLFVVEYGDPAKGFEFTLDPISRYFTDSSFGWEGDAIAGFTRRKHAEKYIASTPDSWQYRIVEYAPKAAAKQEPPKPLVGVAANAPERIGCQTLRYHANHVLVGAGNDWYLMTLARVRNLLDYLLNGGELKNRVIGGWRIVDIVTGGAMHFEIGSQRVTAQTLADIIAKCESLKEPRYKWRVRYIPNGNKVCATWSNHVDGLYDFEEAAKDAIRCMGGIAACDRHAVRVLASNPDVEA